MKSSENKLIADKLESLDCLPEGYHPDMDSKWALLEETMNERESAGFRVNKIWMNVAACLLILVASIWLLIYMQRPITITVNQQHSPSKTKVIQNTPSPDFAEKAKHARAVKYHPKDPVQNEKHVPQSGNEIVFVPEVLPLSKDSVIHEPEKIIQLVLTEKIPVKPKKQRYVQVDFDDPLNTVYIPVNKSNFAQPFRIKLGIGNPSEKSDNYSENTATIKLRQNF